MERSCLFAPPDVIYGALSNLSACADALLQQNAVEARRCFDVSNLDEVRRYTTMAQGGYPDPAINRRLLNEGAKVWGASVLPPSGYECAAKRDQREPHKHLESEIIARDGYICRYCGVPVVDKAVCEGLLNYFTPYHGPRRPNRETHALLLAVKLVCDHVFPYQLGGDNIPENLVVSCGTCNYGKWSYTLKQLQLADPRSRRKLPLDGFEKWDGLTRLSAIFA